MSTKRKRARDIKLSDKHGLNPSLNVCPFCGKDKEIILFGKLKGDAEAPKRVIANYEPCDKCKAKMQLGVTVIEVTTEYHAMEPITHNPTDAWMTGRWCVLKTESAKRLFGEVPNNIVLLEKEAYTKLKGE
jgi:hypothetical protein